MENLKHETAMKPIADREASEFMQKKQFLLSLNAKNTAAGQDEVVRFIQGILSKNPTLEAEYKDFNGQKDFPLESLYYFFLERYGLFLHISKTKDESLFAPIQSWMNSSAQAYGIGEHFPTAENLSKETPVYAIADRKVNLFGLTRDFLTGQDSNRSITMNMAYIQDREEGIYKKIYGTTNPDLGKDTVIAHEFTHASYTSPNYKRITSIDWKFIGVQDPKSIIEFLAEFSELMIDPRTIAYWLAVFVRNMKVLEDGKLTTTYVGPQDFIYNKTYEILSTIFDKKGLSLSNGIRSGYPVTDIVRATMERLTPEDIQSVRNSFRSIQKTIVDTIEKAPK